MADLSKLRDFKFYAQHILKIQTKVDGLRPFKLRKVQAKYIDHLREQFPGGMIRSIVLKPRQSGFSTIVAGINMHKILTRQDERGIIMADKLGRADDIFGIYDTFRNNVKSFMLPEPHKKDVFNSEEIYFENQRSGFSKETQNDPHAGRAASRNWAHLSEFAFYGNADSIDEGVQNSIPLHKRTRIFKESTAFGMGGVGAAFFNQWEAACRSESIYKPFFVAWYEIEDYAIAPNDNFKLSVEEKDLMKRYPEITVENLNWRRLKLTEYASSTEQIFTPQERFNQDFPFDDITAFLSTGRPVFDQDKLKRGISLLTQNKPRIEPIRITREYLSMYPDMLTVYFVPQPGEKYIIGADVAEGLDTGDYSHAFIMTKGGKQVAFFHGHIDADHFGRILVELARVYNEATIVVETNNMGHTTLNAIKQQNYLKLYMRSVFDEIGKVETKKVGWVTTRSSKQTMLSKLIAMYRDDEIMILDVNLLKEMAKLTRESDGNVDLGGRDRVVAACLACMGIDQVYEPATVTNSEINEKVLLETVDYYRDKVHPNTKW